MCRRARLAMVRKPKVKTKPRLAGQLFPYTVKELTNWSRERGQGRGSDTSVIMVPTAHNLTQSQIAAIAAYLSYLQ